MTPQKRRIGITAAAIVLSVLIVAVVFLSGGSDDTSDDMNIPEPPVVTVQPFTTQNEENLEIRLASSDKTERAKALIPEIRPGSLQTGDLMPPGAKVDIVPSSFVADNLGGADVLAEVKLDENVIGTIHFHLWFEEQQWLISTSK